MKLPLSHAYLAVQDKLEAGECVTLDGGLGAELEDAPGGPTGYNERWGTWALYEDRHRVGGLHHRYVAAGCDVISTNTWSILHESASWGAGGPHAEWEEAARVALQLAREATAEAGGDEPAVAFCLHGDQRSPRALEALELLAWQWRENPPDLVLFETFSELPGSDALSAIDIVNELGLPIWVSLRRGPGGMAEPDGFVMTDKAPEALARVASELEARGVKALLANCVPSDVAASVVAELGQVTDLPVGCMPNLGRGYGRPGARANTPDAFVGDLLTCWEAGARILGGCCGTSSRHIAAVNRALASAPAWSARGV